MCGRFTMTYPDAHLLAEELGVPFESLPADYRPRFNIAPTDKHLILRIKGESREAVPARWGLVNWWARDRRDAAKQINARAETVATRPAFREAFDKRRCVVPADGFFEWQRRNGTKQPFWIHRPGGELLLLAGLYESWQPNPGEWERTFTIVTTDANHAVAQLHDRMPVVLDEESAALWMFSTTPPESLKRLLRPVAEGQLLLTPVSTRVNKVENDDPAVLEPVALSAQLL